MVELLAKSPVTVPKLSHLYRFNLRVLECRLAAMLLAHLLPAAADTTQGLDWRQVSILKQVEGPLLQHAAGSTGNPGSSGVGLADVLAATVRQLLPQESYTLQQASAD